MANLKITIQFFNLPIEKSYAVNEGMKELFPYDKTFTVKSGSPPDRFTQNTEVIVENALNNNILESAGPVERVEHFKLMAQQYVIDCGIHDTILELGGNILKLEESK